MWALFTLEIDVKDCWKDNRVNLKMLRATDIFLFQIDSLKKQDEILLSIKQFLKKNVEWEINFVVQTSCYKLYNLHRTL